MFHRTFTHQSAAAVLALTLVFAGCHRKADSESESNANPPGQQANAAKQATQAQPGQQGSGQATGGAGNPSTATGSGPANAAGQASGQSQARSYTLDAGSAIVVRTITPLSTKTAKAGDRFEASLEQPLLVGDQTIAPKGTSVFGQVTVSDPSGKLKGSSYLGVQLTAIALPNGDRVSIQTATNERVSQGTGRKTAKKVGIGAGIGAVIGAIAGGGKGAAIGAGAGGAAGGGYAYATGGNPAVIASETVLTFHLTAPMTVTPRN
jgi:hypothetical protein